MRCPKVVLQGALDCFKIQKKNFPAGFQNEDVANTKNPSDATTDFSYDRPLLI